MLTTYSLFYAIENDRHKGGACVTYQGSTSDYANFFKACLKVSVKTLRAKDHS